LSFRGSVNDSGTPTNLVISKTFPETRRPRLCETCARLVLPFGHIGEAGGGALGTLVKVDKLVIYDSRLGLGLGISMPPRQVHRKTPTKHRNTSIHTRIRI